MNSNESPVRFVKLLPEWSEGDDSMYIITEDRGERIAITPAHWDYARQGAIRPVEVVGAEMLQYI
jgi:hypothetical protein